MIQQLTTTDHSRDVAGLKYVYPVISRRAEGLSIGINFNTNNACNWRCVYCQVPDLQRGIAPRLDFQLLEDELRFFLEFVLQGDFYEQFNIPQQQRVIKDIAISGNGEPTSLPDFDKAVSTIGEIANEKGLFPGINFVLISNGSLMHHPRVQAGLSQLKVFQGEVWFKLDRGTQQERKLINNCRDSNRKVLEQLAISASLCETKLQTCLLENELCPWSKSEKNAYLKFLQQIKDEDAVSEVMLYSIARQSHQPEARQLSKVSAIEMQQFADQIKELGYRVSVND